MDWILFGENEEFMWIGFFFFFSDALKSLLLIPVTPKVHTEDKDKSNAFLNNFLKIKCSFPFKCMNHLPSSYLSSF